MKGKPSRAHLDFFVGQVVGGLPDSLRGRKTCLVVLLHLLPRDSEHRPLIHSMLEALHIHEVHQLKLQGLALDGKPPAGDGHC